MGQKSQTTTWHVWNPVKNGISATKPQLGSWSRISSIHRQYGMMPFFGFLPANVLSLSKPWWILSGNGGNSKHLWEIKLWNHHPIDRQPSKKGSLGYQVDIQLHIIPRFLNYNIDTIHISFFTYWNTSSRPRETLTLDTTERSAPSRRTLRTWVIPIWASILRVALLRWIISINCSGEYLCILDFGEQTPKNPGI